MSRGWGPASARMASAASDPAHYWHVNVEERRGRGSDARYGERLRAVMCCLKRDRDRRERGHEVCEHFSSVRIVVSDQDMHGIGQAMRSPGFCRRGDILPSYGTSTGRPAS